MSIKLMSAAWDTALPSTEKMVLLCLCDFANDEGVCWPSMERLARKCSVTDRTVRRAMGKLEEWGFVRREKRLHETWICHITMTGQDVQSDRTSATSRPDTVSPKPSKNHHNNKKGARVCPDNFWPDPTPGSKTAQVMIAWPQDRLEREVERFIAHHQAKGNKYADWQRAWTTWALSDFQQRTNNGKQYGNSNQRTAELAAAKMQSFG
jgi:hypothetical protein